MTDFLTNLAARTLTRPALQPRVPSRFEPKRRGEPLQPAEQTEYTRVTAPPTPRTQRSPVAAPPLAAEEIESHKELPRSVRRGAEPTRLLLADERPQRRAARHVTEDRHETVARPEQRQSVATQPHVRETTKVIEVPVLPRERQPAQVPAETIVETRTETREVRVPVERPAERPVTQSQTRSRYEEAPPVISDPRDEPLPQRFREERAITSTTTRRTRELRNAVPPDAAEGPMQPEVHVSIGRVEVRATTTPAADKRRRQQSPVMTIDDYVAHRARKERR